MKLIFTSEDEGKILFRKLEAECFLLGNGEAEVKLTSCPDKVSVRTIDSFAKKVARKLAKEKVTVAYLITEAGTALDEKCRESKVLRMSRSEYMFKLEPDPDREKEPGAELLLTNGVEEEEDTIIVSSGEKDVFTAKLRPYSDGMYLYGVEVREDMRHRGFGKKYMKGVAYAFRDSRIYLQVGSPNVIACKLYRDLGFEVDKELCYRII